MNLGTTGWILVLATLWALFLLTLFLLLPRILRHQGSKLTEVEALFLVVGVALVVRLVPNFLLPIGAGYDIKSYEIVGNLVLSGKDVFASPETANRHPYLPFQMYWMGFAVWLADAMAMPFVKVVRLAPIVADVGIALTLFLCLRRSGSLKDALRGGLLYAVNPIPVFVSAYHGQFDAIPAILLLLSAVSVERSPLLAGGWLGLGILNKSWPVVAFPSLFVMAREWRDRLRFLGGVILVPMIGVGVYLLCFRGEVWTVLRRALGYNWGIGVWGYTYFFRLLSIVEPRLAAPFAWLAHYGRYLTLGTLGLAWLLRARMESPEASTLTILVVFFAVTHAFSIQYLMWVVPFAVLSQDDRWLARYTLGAFSYMLLTYTTLILEMHVNRLLPWPQADWFIIMPAGLPAWLVTVGWARKRLIAKRSPA